MMRNLLLPAVLMSAFLLGACEEEGPLEQTGEEIDETVEEAGENIEDATQ